MEYTDKYNKANKVAYPMYVAGDKVWVKVMDKNQRAPNPKLAPPWERGTIVERGVTGTSYKVERHDRKRKKVKTINVQQIKPFEEGKEEEEERAIVQPPRPVPQASQQTPSEEEDSEEGEDDELPGVDLGQDEEEDEGTERDTSLPVPDTPLPTEDTPAPEEYPPLPETPPSMPATEQQSEGMRTRAQARGGGKARHIPAARTSRQGRSLAKPPPPARESTGRAGLDEKNCHRLARARGRTKKNRLWKTRTN
jgi:hypothetical protein